MAFNLRKRSHLNYSEMEEPRFDAYIYCEQCTDYVYDYCAIHGPLLIVPDNKIPVKTNFQSYVPRAALTIPDLFLHLAPSIIPGAGLGVFSTLTLPRGVRFGPYCGQRTQKVDSMYCWQIYDRNNKRSHVVDAADGDRSNWMRYVNCARHWKEQNLLAYQYKGQLYYRTIKIIPRFSELMVYYGSEYANGLHINLSKYNCDEYYKEIIAQTKIIKDGVQKDYISADQFYFIDEYIEDDTHKNTNTGLESHLSQKSNINAKLDDFNGKSKDEINLKNDNKEEKCTHRCVTCLKVYAKRKYLRKHEETHLETRKYSCEYCLYQTNQNYRLKEHVLVKHTKSNIFLFSCQLCRYKTNVKNNFKIHCLRHEGNVKYLRKIYFASPKQCDICNFKTISRKSLSTHILKHKGNIYKCNLCEYSNHSKFNLSRHISRKHNS